MAEDKGAFGDYAEWSSKLKYYRLCLTDLDNFFQRHSDIFSYGKFMSKKDARNLHKLFLAMRDDVESFCTYADFCGVCVGKDGSVKLMAAK